VRISRRLAWLPLVAELCIIAAYFYFVLHAGAAGVADARKDPQIGISAFSAGLLFAALGGFIVYHRPGNAFGWMLALVPLSWSLKGLTDAYTWYAVFAPHHHAGGTFTAWLSSWDWLPAIGTSGTLLLLVFPDGRLPSRRWRPVGWLAVATMTAVAISFAFAPGPLESFKSIRNPLGVPAWAAGTVKAGSIAFPLLFAAVVASAASLFFRARNGTPVERQQVKWLAYFSGTLIAIAIIFISRGTFDAARAAVLFGSLSTVPLASVIAITRYRLYEIDRIISRTVTYALVTAVLGGAYVLVVLVPTTVLGKGHAPPALIAAGTLVAAALFRPVLRRVRNLIDRRFNRNRYDAAHTIEGFASHVRSEVDIDTLGAELRDVVGRTMQPAHVSLWLRG
jgi:hypothetical protein